MKLGVLKGAGKCLKQEYILLFKFRVEIKFTKTNQPRQLVLQAKFYKWAIWDAKTIVLQHNHNPDSIRNTLNKTKY